MVGTASPRMSAACLTVVATLLGLSCAEGSGPELPVAIPSAIAFDSDRSGNRDIYILWPDGKVERVTSRSAFDGSPDWSPDGQRIAFESNRSGGFEIYLMNVDGSNVRRLTQNTDLEASAAWSPDGSLIAHSWVPAPG